MVGSREDVKVGEITVRGREYPWGVVEIENEQHCDFVKLREMLIRTNMEDLREVGLFKHNHLFFCGKLLMPQESLVWLDLIKLCF